MRGRAARSPRRRQPGPVSDGGFVVPLAHVPLPGPAVNFGFHGGLAAAVALGAVDLPVGVLVGVGVANARHLRT
ncbi:MAG: hypothetical protein M0Z42_05385 [Actinomycetota bacterium]|nr:hypothetical protein [Actinomycetota bacterium]